MRIFILLVTVALSAGCVADRPPSGGRSVPPTSTPIPTPAFPKDGTYPGRGTVTRINLEAGSVELDHEPMPDMLMPAMRMEFNVKDRSDLRSLRIGDAVDFMLEYKHPTETIVSIKKAK